jgi:hypothetical protein
MATGRVPTTANSPLTAKGDLFTYSTAPARLAVGNDGETIVADSSTSTGLRYQGSIEAGKNFVINGGFDIWQRGTSFTQTGGFTADRWQVGGSYTATRQTTGVPYGSQYCLRAVNTVGSYAAGYYFVETSQSYPLQGQTVTISAKFRRNATASFGLKLSLSKSSTVDGGGGATWTEIASETVSNANLPTGTGASNWYTAKATVVIPADGTANGLRIGIEPTITDVAGAYWEAAQVQLELGSVPTTFSRAGGTIQGELAACQRYYYRSTGYSGSRYCTGFNETTTNFIAYLRSAVTMRVTPTAVDYSNLQTYDGAFRTVTNVALVGSVQDVFCVNCTVSGVTANQSGVLSGSNASSFIGFSAEL